MESISTSRFSATAWLLALALFVAGLFLYTSRNDFPFYYHPDEKGKVWQIQHHSRNSNHPMMLLTATALDTLFHVGPPLTQQEVVKRGRDVSAFFASVTVAALALLAWRMCGAVGGPWAAALGGLCAGLFLLADPLQFDLAHYMKEDSALGMGLALSFLALHLYWERRDDRALIFTGIAVAAAVSGKYIGWLLLPFALGMIHAGTAPEQRKARRNLFLKSFGLAFLVFNYSLIFNPIKPFSSLFREMDGVTYGHHGLTRQVPHTEYVEYFLRLPWVIQALFAAYLAGLLARFRKTTPAEWLVPGFSLLLFTLMSFSPKASERYFLPVEIAVWFGAAVGLVWAVSALASRCGRLRPAVLLLLTLPLAAGVLHQLKPRLEAEYAALALDDRLELRKWISANVPPSAIIAMDKRAHLGTEEPAFGAWAKLPMNVLSSDYVADLGTLEELRAKGVTHVAVVHGQYARFDQLKPTKKVKDTFERQRSFYASLGLLKDSTAQPGLRELWKTAPGTNDYLQPGMILFEIAAPAAPRQP